MASSTSKLSQLPNSQSQTVVSSASVYGTKIADTNRLKALTEKVRQLINTPKIQGFINNQQLSSIKMSKSKGVVLVFANGETSAVIEGLFDEIIDQGPVAPWAAQDKRAGKALYESLIEAEKQAQMQAQIEKLTKSADKIAGATNPIFKQQSEQVLRVSQQDSTNKPSLVDKTITCISEPLWQAIDISSFVRNSKAILEMRGDLFEFTGSISTGLTLAGFFSGILSTLSALLGVHRGIDQAVTAAKYRDSEGIAVHSLVNTPMSASYAVVGSAMSAANIGALQGTAASVAIAAIAGLVASIAALAMYVFILISAGHGRYIAGKFSDEMNAALTAAVLNPSNQETVKLLAVLIKLRQQITLSRAEYETVRDPNNPAEEKAAVEKLLKKKWAEFSRRTSEACLNKLLEIDENGKFKLDALIADLSAEQPNLEASKTLIRMVYEHNYRAKVNSYNLMVIGVLGIAASVAGFILTGGLANLLFAAGALAWIGIDSSKFNQWIGSHIWEWRKDAILPPELKTQEMKDHPKNQVLFCLYAVLATILAPIYAIPVLLYLEGKSLHNKLLEHYKALPSVPLDQQAQMPLLSNAK